MKTKVFLDFDGTIFDTNILKKKLFNLCDEVGFSRDEVIDSYRAEAEDGLFSPYQLFEHLLKTKEFDINLAKTKLTKSISKSAKYLFDDSIEFLIKFDRTKFEVNLMTLGNFKFQKAKVENSEIAKYFDHIYYVDKNKWQIIDQYIDKNEKFIFIDDREDTVYNIAQKYPKSVCLCIKRQDEDRDDPYHRPAGGQIIKIKSLSEALAYIKN